MLKQLYVQKVAPGSLFLVPYKTQYSHSATVVLWFYSLTSAKLILLLDVHSGRPTGVNKGQRSFLSPLSVRSKQRRKLFTCVCLNRGKANYGQEKQSVHVCFREFQKNRSLSCVQTVVV